MKNLYQLYKELTNIDDKNEFRETLRHNRVPEEDREYQAETPNHSIPKAYWDYQNDGTHFCSECGCDAPYNKDYKEICSTWCPTCGCYMTHREDKYE